MTQKIRMMRAVALAVMGAATASSAQDLGIKAPPQEKPIWILNGTVHTVSGGAIEGGSIEVRDGVITRVLKGGPTMDDGFADRNTVVNATGMHVYPGFIAANTLIGLLEIGAVRATLDYREVGSITPEVRAAVAVNPDSTIIPVTRSNGVLTFASLPVGGPIPGRGSVMRADGWTWEDMTILDDAGLLVNWPNMRIGTGWWVTRSAAEQEKDIAENLRTIEQAFADAEAYLDARDADPSIPVDIRWEAMRGVLREGGRVFIRANELEQIESAVSWGSKRGLKMVILGGSDAAKAAALLKEHDVGVIVAGTLRTPKRRDSAYDEAYRLPAMLEEAGVRWCLASTGGSFESPHERNLPYHAAMAAAHGLNRDAAIRSITLSAAEMLGVDDRLGSIEVGKAGTLIITDGDPLEIPTEVRYAWIDGRMIDLSNKHRVLDEKYREKYRQIGGLE